MKGGGGKGRGERGKGKREGEEGEGKRGRGERGRLMSVGKRMRRVSVSMPSMKSTGQRRKASDTKSNVIGRQNGGRFAIVADNFI